MRTVTFNSIFDIYPNTIQEQEVVIGYRIPGKRTKLSFPFSLKLRKKIQPDSKGRYRASDIGLEPVIIKQNHASHHVTYLPKAHTSNPYRADCRIVGRMRERQLQGRLVRRLAASRLHSAGMGRFSHNCRRGGAARHYRFR